VEVARYSDPVDLAALLADLRANHGIRALLCEGGPRLHGDLIDAGLVDELFVTHAPKLGGGVGPGLISGLAEAERPLELGWLLAEDSTGELFARYLVPR
jgi:riboflavin biosynthesis pyrimidine reductase